MKKLFILSSMLLLGSLCIKAEGDAIKVGYIKMDVIFSRDSSNKLASVELMEGAKDLELKLMEKGKEIQKAEENLQKFEKESKAKLKVAGADARKAFEADLKKKKEENEALKQNFINMQQSESMVLQKNILEKLEKTINEIAEAKGFDLILGMGALYVGKKVDITEEVANALNKVYTEEKTKKEKEVKPAEKKPVPTPKTV